MEENLLNNVETQALGESIVKNLTENGLKAEVVERPKVRTIGSTEVGGTPTDVTEEDVLAKLDEVKIKKEVRARMIKVFNTQLIQVEQELNKGKTIDDILDEIKNKKSKLPKMARDFVENFESDSIKEMIEQRNDYLKKQHTNRVSGIISHASTLSGGTSKFIKKETEEENDTIKIQEAE